MWEGVFYYDKRKSAKSAAIAFAILFFIVSIFLVIVASFIRNDNLPENLTPVEVTLVEIRANDEDSKTEMFAKDDGHTYFISYSNVSKEDVMSTLKIDETYTFYVSYLRANKNSALTAIVSQKGADGKENIIFDCIPKMEENYQTVTYVGISAAIIAAISLSAYIFFRQRPKYGKAWCYEPLFLNNFNAVIVGRKRWKPTKRPWQLTLLIATLAFFIVTLITGIILIVGEESSPKSAVGYILLCSSVVVTITLLTIIAILNDRQNVPLFAKNYTKYLKEGADPNDVTPFTEEGLNDGEGTVPYEKVDFYVAVQYRKLFVNANIYVISENYSAEGPWIAHLTADNYAAIKKYGVNVYGLDEVVENLEQHIRENVDKKGPLLVFYKKDGIIKKRLNFFNQNRSIVQDPRIIAKLEAEEKANE